MSRRYQKASVAPKLLIVAALVGGVGFAFKAEIMKLINPPPAEKTTVTTAPKPKPAKKVVAPKKLPEPIKKVEPKKVVVAPAPKRADVYVSKERRAEAVKVHQDGVKAVRQLEFVKAAELFVKEADMLKRDKAAHAKAMGLAKRVGIYSDLLKNVPFNPEAAAEMVTIRRYNGPDIKEVAIVKKTDTQYIIRKRSGISMPIDRDMVEKIIKISAKERKLRLLNKFKNLEKTKKPTTASDYFELAKAAYQDKLKPQALGYLDKAWKAGGENLFKIVRTDGATRFLKNAYWCESTGRTMVAKIWCRKVMKDYSDLPDKVKAARELIALMDKPKPKAYKPTVVFKEKKKPSSRPKVVASATTTKEPEEVTVVVDKISTTKGANAALVNKINAKFDEGMDHFMKGRPGQPNSNKHLANAVKLFDEVSELCEKALKSEPNNVAIQNRQTDATRHAYHARKMQTL